MLFHTEINNFFLDFAIYTLQFEKLVLSLHFGN